MTGLWQLAEIRAKEESGATMITMLFFLFCLGSLLSLLLFSEQADFLEMNVQHTADLVTKGARAAGLWEYTDTDGETQSRLYATSQEAEQADAEVIRGAREEAAILWRLNKSSLESRAAGVSAVHQRGERAYLYRQGIYHLQVEVEQRIPVFWGELDVKIARVSQSGVYD
ncbi:MULTISPECIES: hypothetical protein [Brevibacillus]|uniref:hypothetical protein n=1 Tax=Brevibacillus TaxID=55080 RepID=UPI0002A4EE61|nr:MULTISPECIES: hypothetical protein [Brevibacillus]ELK41581.1 hypothetical protein D478_13173 [Brevibacillus agri BAB-2500]MBY0054516.1 hypothetical protein [Brevibacillus agri]MDN4096189.1 hypothetical protein [Brevibacillus agri]MED3501877.1 hypothetical protein [Brevibacillus agri]QHZ59023.1 hypothetical protein M655_027360 [Brevibacillus sp. NSP2.1]